MFNDIALEKKDNEASCAITWRKIKEYATNFNDGHWAFLGPGEESKRRQGYANGYGGKWEDFVNSGHLVFQGVRPLGRGTPKKKNNRDTIHFNGEYCNSDLLYRTADPKVLARCPQKFKSSRRILSHGWIFQDYRMLRETECFIIWKITIRCRLWATLNISVQRRNSTIRSRKQITFFTTTLEDDGWWKRTSMCKECTAPRNWVDSRPYASIDTDQEIGPVLNIGIATVIDVPGLEVQVPSLSSPGYPMCILISRGQERFVNEIHRHNSDIVNYNSSLRTKEENLNDVCFESSKPAVVNHGQSSQDSNNVKTKVENSSVHRETVASTIRVAPASSKSSSDGSGSSNPTSLHPETKFIYIKKEIPKEDRIWTFIPGCQKCKRDSFETRTSKCVTNVVRHHDQNERETDGAMHWDVILPVLKGRFRSKLEKDFTDEDWLHYL